jgi:hypothetical protein
MVLPYLKGLVIIKCGFFYIALYGSIVYSVFVVIIFADLILVLNNWYQSTFQGQRREYLFSLFAEFFF